MRSQTMRGRESFRIYREERARSGERGFSLSLYKTEKVITRRQKPGPAAGGEILVAGPTVLGHKFAFAPHQIYYLRVLRLECLYFNNQSCLADLHYRKSALIGPQGINYDAILKIK
jgi:hypothetical protein